MNGVPFLFCTTFRSFFWTAHYFFFLCAFLAKMATYSLVIDNVYLVLENHDRQWISCLFLKTSDFQMESL